MRQALSFGLGTWSWRQDLNLRPAAYKAAALPTELHQRTHVTMLVLRAGLEPACLSTLEPKSSASTSFATGA